ncbi:hypothetical protein A2716_04345 [candidate division WWE3 bacterium RIFCSPHIGHO2_01_FULL_40_23]|uniref:YHYH domain-containing protein n=1 Tax=candidate division WWE3 bacterium RIFCSPLOWO2_01_FULL_41_18 TaxID=1802625 RepID=A0A1F4VD87_UNCKA|nr:MAG: hypothetical protein A2716_04345 [candidate division WWE3 bacterium RIFCSPHIGHO2_01_FULL_40_23]OGC55104.1 MAG: hypothetical protein A3A78_03955 [candidate division WWE3 bacterium RIFCSPLOWO2_01_FULL_41_18]
MVLKAVSVIVLISAAFLLLTQGVFAARGGKVDANGCKPGWGFGDKNHCHSGPPGSVQPHP